MESARKSIPEVLSPDNRVHARLFNSQGHFGDGFHGYLYPHFLNDTISNGTENMKGFYIQNPVYNALLLNQRISNLFENYALIKLHFEAQAVIYTLLKHMIQVRGCWSEVGYLATLLRQSIGLP